MTSIRNVYAAFRVATVAPLAAVSVAICVPIPIAHADAQSMLLSIEDVRAVSGNADLASAPTADRPVGQHQYDRQIPAECHAVLNQDDAFSAGYSEFRSVTYTGPANRSVTQTVALYPDSSSARAALTAVGKQLNACSQLQAPEMPISVQVLDQKTFAVCRAQCATIYRAAGPALIGVDAARFGDSDRIATAVLQQISARAPDA